jgi:hypothetical protein
MKLLMENWKKFVNEQEELPTAQQAPQQWIPITNQTSFKELDKGSAINVVKQLMSGDDNTPVLQAQGKWSPGGAAAKAWVTKIGPENVIKRILAIGAKIPEKGLPKSKMPFLPGPEDAQGEVSDVEDALTPSGKYNVDMMERTDPPAPNAIGHVGSDPNAVAFMQAGLKDGDPDDDVLQIKMGGSFPAAAGIPTQTNILIAKALGMAINGVAGGNIGAYASLNNEILDGHHRWAATMLNKPDADIGTFAQIDLEKLGTEATLQYLTAIGNALGNKTKTK